MHPLVRTRGCLAPRHLVHQHCQHQHHNHNHNQHHNHNHNGFLYVQPSGRPSFAATSHAQAHSSALQQCMAHLASRDIHTSTKATDPSQLENVQPATTSPDVCTPASKDGESIQVASKGALGSQDEDLGYGADVSPHIESNNSNIKKSNNDNDNVKLKVEVEDAKQKPTRERKIPEDNTILPDFARDVVGLDTPGGRHVASGGGSKNGDHQDTLDNVEDATRIKTLSFLGQLCPSIKHNNGRTFTTHEAYEMLTTLGARTPQRISFKDMIRLGLSAEANSLLQSSLYLADELSVRISRRIVEIDRLPPQVKASADIDDINMRYLKSVVALRDFVEDALYTLERGSDLHHKLYPTTKLPSRRSEHVIARLASWIPSGLASRMAMPYVDHEGRSGFKLDDDIRLCRSQPAVAGVFVPSYSGDETGFPSTHWARYLNVRFAGILEDLIDRHSDIVVLVARVFRSAARKLTIAPEFHPGVQSFLDNLHYSRVGVRLLVGHHIQLLKQFNVDKSIANLKKMNDGSHTTSVIVPTTPQMKSNEERNKSRQCVQKLLQEQKNHEQTSSAAANAIFNFSDNTVLTLNEDGDAAMLQKNAEFQRLANKQDSQQQENDEYDEDNDKDQSGIVLAQELPQYVGIICTRTDICETILEAAEEATFICERTHGQAPPVKIYRFEEDNPYKVRVTDLTDNIAEDPSAPAARGNIGEIKDGVEDTRSYIGNDSDTTNNSNNVVSSSSNKESSHLDTHGETNLNDEQKDKRNRAQRLLANVRVNGKHITSPNMVSSQLTYIPVHARHILFELIKNAFSASLAAGGSEVSIEIVVHEDKNDRDWSRQHLSNGEVLKSNYPKEMQHLVDSGLFYLQALGGNNTDEITPEEAHARKEDLERFGGDFPLPPRRPNGISVLVIDRGNGIPTAAVENIFNYAYTTSALSKRDETFLLGGADPTSTATFVQNFKHKIHGDGSSSATSSGSTTVDPQAIASSLHERVVSSLGAIRGVPKEEERLPPMSGLGYGLPLSRLYARFLGGEVAIYTKVHRGTIAEFWIPAQGCMTSKF